MENDTPHVDMKEHLVIRRREIGDGGRLGTLTTINRGDGFHVELQRYVKVTHAKPKKKPKKGNEEST